MKEKNKVKILEILMCHIESIHHQEERVSGLTCISWLGSWVRGRLGCGCKKMKERKKEMLFS